MKVGIGFGGRVNSVVGARSIGVQSGSAEFRVKLEAARTSVCCWCYKE